MAPRVPWKGRVAQGELAGLKNVKICPGEQGYYFKDVELNSIVEFKIKSIKEDNDQVELEF